MNEAYTEAKSTVSKFITALEKDSHPEARHLVKARVEADGEVEYVWLEPVEYVD